MQHGYAPYLGNIQTHALAAVGVSHHGSFIFHGAKCYYTPWGRSQMVRCDWLAFGKHQCPVHFRFHENICYILVTKPYTHAASRCEMRLEDAESAQGTSHSCKGCCWNGRFCVRLRYNHGTLHFGLTPVRIYHGLLSISSTKNFHRPEMIFNIKCSLSS